MSPLEAKIQEFYDISERLKSMEKEKDLLRETLLKIAKDKGKSVINTSNFTLTITQASKETVSLAKLKPVFGAKLEPFINCTFYDVVKAVPKG